MSNPGGINFNVSPYFDDYDEDKKFVRVLYRPGRAVQARELTQAQTYQQKQVERFASYFFKQGSILDGCETSLDLRMDYVKLQTNFNGTEVDVADFEGVEIFGATTGIRAYVGIVADIDGTDPKTLYINYLSAGALILTTNAAPSTMVVGNQVNLNAVSNTYTATLQTYWTDPITGVHKIAVTGSGVVPFVSITDPPVTANTIALDGSTVITLNVTAYSDQREAKVFANSEMLFTSDYAGRAYANTATTNAVRYVENEGLATEKVYTKASKVTIGDGTMYVAEHFVKNTPQTIILDKYSNEPSYKIGLVPTKTFIDSIADTSLVDNAQGTPNFQAPGADRFKIDTALTKIALNQDTDETDFVSILEVEDGVLKKRRTVELEGKIEEAVAKRTFEESGDYTVSDPKISVREHLSVSGNNGRYTLADGGNNELLLVEVDPFVSYVQGFRNELLVKTGVNLRKGLDTQYVEQVQTQLSFGSSIYIKEMVGSWDFMESTVVDLYDTVQRAISNTSFSSTTVSGTKIGEARIKSVEYISGTPGTTDAVYNVYLYNVTMNAGRLFEDVRSLYDSASPSRFADVVLNSLGRAVLRETAFDKLIWELPYQGIKTLRDEFNNVESGFEFKKEFTVAFTSGVATISTTDITETFSGTGLLTEIQKNGNYIVIPASTANTSALTGTVSVTAGTKIVTGSSTSFASGFNAGDVIRIGSQDVIVDSISNNTYLTLKSNHTAGASGAAYYKVFPAGLPIGLGGVGSSNASRTVNVTTPTSIQIDIKEGVTFSADVVATMNRANAREKAKILNYQQQTIINANTHSNGLVGPYSLGYSDGYRLHAIYQSSDFDTAPSTSNTVVTSSYTFDNGQRDNTYEHATITPKVGVVPTGRLLAVFDYFTHDTTQGVGYASINSYPINDTAASNTTINTTDVPVYTSTKTGVTYNLKDCIDFRLVKSANTAATNPIDAGTYQVPTGGLHIPTPSSDYTADLIYYRGRIARVFINSRGELGINDGTPGNPTPLPPPQVPDTLELAEFVIPPYPSVPGEVEISPFKNRRFTMKDISKIQDRVNNLEYYTALNQLEKEARDKILIDDEGLDRFKNGILVDPFTGHNVADVSSEYYSAAIDRQDRYVTAYSNNEVQIGLKYTSTGSSGVTVTPGNKLILSYTEKTFANQPYASVGLNLAQELTYTWVGDLEVLPATDNWLQTTRDPNKDFVVDLTGQADNWKELIDAWNTEVAPLSRHWTGIETRTTSTTSQTFANRRLTTVRRDVTTRTESELQQNAIIDISQREVKQAVDRVADISIPHIMRSRDFIFEARSMKDGAPVYAFFDGINVTANCTQIALVGNTTIDDVYALFDNNGILATDNTKYVNVAKNADGSMRVIGNKIYGRFRVPANSFYVGQREFKLTDSSQNNDSSTTTYAKTSIFATGLSIVKSQDVLNTRPFKVSFDDPRAVETVSRRTSVTTTDTVISSVIWDPVAQSFYVDENTHPDGIYLTSVDLFFKQKSTNRNLGVTVEIREMLNGFPTRKIVGGEVARRENSQINVSATAATVTTFTFKNPIYLLPGTQYCFTVKPDGNSTDFVIWTAELGQIDITNSQVSVKIDKQPAAGVVFTSSNDFTWSVRQNQDIKFKLKIAQFSTTSSGVAVLQNLPIDANQTYTSLIPNIENLNLSKTNITYELRRADSTYQLTDYIPIKNLDRIIESSSKQVSNTVNETAQNIKSLSLRATLSTRNRDISPYIDLQRVNVALSKNIINNETFNTLTGTVTFSSGNNAVTGSGTAFNTEINAGEYVLFGDEYRQVIQVTNATHILVSNNFTTNGSGVTAYSQNEENPTGPYASETRYITRRVALNDGFEASDLAVYLNINRPAGTSIKVYYKILNENDTDNFDNKFYHEMRLDGTETFSQNPNSFTEEKYIISTVDKTGGNNILNGTVNIGTGSVNVVGTSTRFLEEVRIGDTIAVGASRIERVVDSVSNNTFLTVSSAFSTTATGQDVYKVLNNVVGYTTPDGRSYSGMKYFAIKIVFLSNNISYVPKVKNLRAIALA
jgi:hypothetical protein